MERENNLESSFGKGALAFGAAGVVMEIAGLPFASLPLFLSTFATVGWLGLRFSPFRRRQSTH